MKIILTIGAFLFLLQGVAKLIRDIMTITQKK
jgi:TRAP-type mannitol/chloroaromatic compound transport system permease small subunit